MQDKYSIGPVTIVQLVGLQAKPKIASAQADGAVRAADAVPSSAAVGGGNELSVLVDEIAASSHNLKTAPSLGLVTSPPGARIALEAGADRPVVDANAPAPAIDPSAFDLLLQELGLILPPTTEPAKPSTVTISPDTTAPAIIDSDIPATDDAAIFDAPFDDAKSIDGDRILDFAIMGDEGGIQPDATSAPGGTGEYDHMLTLSITTDWMVDMNVIIPSGTPGPQASDLFAPNETAHSSSDAITPI